MGNSFGVQQLGLRHPVEMMVSAFHCIANPGLSVRNKLLGAHAKNDTISRWTSLYSLTGSGGNAPIHLFVEHHLHFMKGFTQSTCTGVASSEVLSPTLLHSKYELMVTNFSLWAKQLLEHVVDKLTSAGRCIAPWSRSSATTLYPTASILRSWRAPISASYGPLLWQLTRDTRLGGH